MVTKALFKSGEYIRCFEMLQKQYTEAPTFNVLLMLYGKFVVKTMANEIKQRKQRRKQSLRDTTAQADSVDAGYLGSGIGALEECARTCLTQRQPYINYMIGFAYKLLKMPLRSYEYWKRAMDFKNGALQPQIQKTLKIFLDEF